AGGTYRGVVDLTAVPGGVQVVNELGLEDYVRGVVSAESPASWPIQALKAQAVAARGYAVTTSHGGGFDQYADTRSQVYRGVAAETTRTDAAGRETRGEVVTYRGRAVTTYFFSTAGGARRGGGRRARCAPGGAGTPAARPLAHGRHDAPAGRRRLRGGGPAGGHLPRALPRARGSAGDRAVSAAPDPVSRLPPRARA